ncbi:MAG: hypothetical protein WCF81_00925 [Roseiarcus sp.]
MKANVIRWAAALAPIVFAAPLPATAQYFPPALIIVPPAQDYAAPRPAPKPQPQPDKAKPSDALQSDGPKGHYRGRTFVPD